jgi:ABC-type nickel/cobalt efflux system permease component RcnA
VILRLFGHFSWRKTAGKLKFQDDLPSTDKLEGLSMTPLAHGTSLGWEAFGATTSPVWVLAIAFLLGLLHALEPGHGKTAMWLYMASGVRRPWHPVVMGFSTALSHSLSLLVIALTVHAAHHVITCDHQHEHLVSTWLQWISTGLIFAIGLWMLVGAIRGQNSACECCNHHHQQPQTSVTADRESAAVPSGSVTFVQLGGISSATSTESRSLAALPVSRSAETGSDMTPSWTPVSDRYRTTALLGVAIGLLPCPSALAAYFASLSAGQPSTAYWTILWFSLGIGVSLTLVGWLLQWFGGGIAQRMSRFQHVPWPILRAALILTVAIFYAWRLT